MKIYSFEVFQYFLADIFITPEIEVELNHFSPKSWNKQKTFVVPITNERDFQRTLNDGFDTADASIFGISSLEKYYILSEDRPLIQYGKIYRINIMFFIDFLQKLYEYEILGKKEIHRLNQSLYNLRNINKTHYTKIKNMIKK